MAHPLLWPKKQFFYPIGNTPATCFTQQLAPEDAADVLLLGCGDPRSIMFTVHVDLGDKRALDFTCCDAEPAVLARNIILFTMVADSDPNDAMLDNVWTIFYHFYLDKVSLNRLLDQCRKLVDMSTTVESWSSSKYGDVFRFCTDASLLQIRDMWIKYLETETLSQSEKEALSLSFSAGMKNVLKTQKGVTTTAFRSAGPLWANLESMGADHFDKFWTTGTTSKPASHINPTFAYSLSGRKFNAHHGTDPLLSYHLAVPLAPTKLPPRSPVTKLDELDKAIKVQFRAWCTSFRTRLLAKTPQIVIRYFIGDALAFCQTLYHCRLLDATETGVYTTPWGCSKIHLRDEDYSLDAPNRAPLSFNIIDTSNLSDHLGLLNVLFATTHLLRDTWSSILHTHSLHSLLFAGDYENLQKGLLEKACADISMLSLLLGLVPCRHLSEITSVSSTHELLRVSTMKDNQFYDLLSWKKPLKQKISSDEPLRCDADHLGEFFFAMYLKMFADDNVMKTFSLDKLQQPLILHYSRHSFVAFLDLAKSRVETDWTKAMKHFISRIESDKTLLMGLNNYQDLSCSLHLRNVESHIPPVLQASSYLFQGLGWKDVPKVVCIILVVPRQSLKWLEDMLPDEMTPPILQCETRSGVVQNIFSSIRPIFGSVETQGRSTQINIREDAKGWNGSSSLTISFYVPSWFLTTSTEVVLSLRSTPATIVTLMPKLGEFLTVYVASVMDRQHVFFSRHRPDNLGEVQSLLAMSRALKPRNQTSPVLETNAVNFDTLRMQASSLTKRANVVNPKDRDALSAGAIVVSKQISDFAILVTFDEYEKVLEFPLPVDGSSLKTRIARKSFYVEVEAHILADPLNRRNFSLDPFPIFLDNLLPKLSNVHYLHLDRLPALDFASNYNLKWLRMHLGMAFSDSEKTKLYQKEARGTLVELKDTISRILEQFSVHHKGQPLAAGLSCSSQGEIHTLIFVSEIKLDLTSNTVVADACVLPLTPSIAPLIATGLRKILDCNLFAVETLEDEVIAWKQLLPAFAERCRTWKHTVNCEYLSKGIPVSVTVEESPLCGCGQGKNLGRFSQTSAWKSFAPFVTRIALAPLFSTSFLEGTLSAHSEALNRAIIGEERCMHCGNPGNPKLLACSACKVAKYCSAPCQKADWKKHKVSCTVIK